jgi:cell division protein ZapA
MTDSTAQVSIKILEKEYQVACPNEERTKLLDAAELLNTHMLEIRDRGKVVGLDRIAVMAALNMANDLLESREQEEAVETHAKKRVQAMREQVETTLQFGQQLEF